MDFDWYQRWAQTTDVWQGKRYKLSDAAFMDKVLGLAGESGEVADKFKKILRDKKGKIGPAEKAELVKELGDTLWYIATIARYLGVPFSEVAVGNYAKLSSRKARNELHGTGDNR